MLPETKRRKRGDVDDAPALEAFTENSRLSLFASVDHKPGEPVRPIVRTFIG